MPTSLQPRVLTRRRAIATLAGGLAVCAVPVQAGEIGQLFLETEYEDGTAWVLLRLTANYGGLLTTSQRVMRAEVAGDGTVAESDTQLPGGRVLMQAQMRGGALVITLRLHAAGAPTVARRWNVPPSSGMRTLKIKD